jgi:PAS domain S-box-containing protein
MRSFFKKLWSLVTHIQVLSVFLAFALMVFLSYYYMSNVERRHLFRYVDNAILNTQSQILSDLKEPETALRIIAENIRNMILNGAEPNDIKKYMTDTTSFIVSDERFMASATGVYGLFDVFDGKLMFGVDWTPPEGYNARERPWYNAAIEAGGGVGITEPYLNMVLNETNITFAQRIFDNEGSPLGIVCLDVLLDRILEYAVNTFVTEGSYGILFDSEFNVLAHPAPAFIGRHLSLMNDGAAIQEILMQDKKISERKVTDYNNNEAIGFIQPLSNGWYLAIIAYSDKYYESVRRIGLILLLLGAFLASTLIFILLSVISGKKKAEERTKVMLDAVPVCASFWDSNGNIIDCNKTVMDLFDLPNKKDYIEKFYDLSPKYQEDGKPSREKSAIMLKKALKEGYCNFEWMHQKLNGEQIPCDIKLIRVNYNKEVIICGYTHDLRELKSMMMKMREADERAMLMLDAAPVGVTMWDRDFNLIDFNYEAARVVGISSKEEYQNKFAEMTPEYQADGRKSSDVMAEYINKAFKEGSFRTTWNHNTVDGETIPFDSQGIRLVLKDEPVVIIYSHDLRDLNSAIAKMREADECTQVMFNATPLSCFMIDSDSKVLECNQEVVRLLGLSGKNDFIENSLDFFPEYQPSGEASKEKIAKFINEAFEEGYSRFELMHQRRDGEQIPTEVSLVRVKFKGVYAVAGFIRDLRELKTMIAEMRRAEIAEESSKAKSDFLAKMSHEIRTPMNAILGITEIQLQDNTLPLVTREALERIYNSGDLLLGIINDILDLSKIEAGKFELASSQYDIASLIHDTVKLNIMRYESKPIDFKLTITENIPSMLVGDELRIKQILNNLLSNAFKYTQEGQIELMLSSELKRDRASANLIIRVSDTGQGMTADQVKKLGDRFSRFNLDANRKTEGTGLGMNITRNLIQLMGGDIIVESTPGMGSVFTVRLPQVCANSEPIGKVLAENLMRLNLKNTTKMRNAQITQEFMPYGRVLVVDDVETNLYVARGLMAPYGISIDTALSGFEAIEKIREGTEYDIVFMDHMMPRMDGIEATKHIRDEGYKRPVVALTANAIAGQAEIFLNNGFDDFISKPIDIRQLNSVLNKLIRDKQSPDVIDEARRQKNTLYAAGGHNIVIDSQLAEFFVRDAKKSIDILEAICENNCRRTDDIGTLIINIHAMKSALANIGESELSGKAAELEQAGRDQNINFIILWLPEFLTSLKEIVEKLLPEDDETEENDDADFAYLQEKLQIIQKACSSYNKKTAKAALTDIKKKTWPRSVKEQLSTLAEHLLHSEFDEAADIANEFKY